MKAENGKMKRSSENPAEIDNSQPCNYPLRPLSVVRFDPSSFSRRRNPCSHHPDPTVALHKRCTLEGLARKIRCPLLVVHGTEDFVPVEQAKRIYEEASGPKEWVLLQGGNHVCNNMPFRYRPLSGDFLARRLAAASA